MNLNEEDKKWIESRLEEQRVSLEASTVRLLGEQRMSLEGSTVRLLEQQRVSIEGSTIRLLEQQRVSIEGSTIRLLEQQRVSIEASTVRLLEVQRAAIEESITDMETKLLTEFQKWASPTELRIQSHATAMRAIDLELELTKERVSKLEPRH